MNYTLGLAGFLACAISAAGSADAAERTNRWSVIEQPSAGASQAVGSTSAGCLTGAHPLPLDGAGYEVIRLSRRRYFGHTDLIAFIEELGRQAKAAQIPTFYIGDMAQPRGGPLPFGHTSHQTGIDVDIWFTLDTKPGMTRAEREEPALPSMISADARIDPAHFGSRQIALLKLAAADPHVDRIFVNPIIKLALCRDFAGATDGGSNWLHRLRPWWGHDDHFHVRLKCPANSPDCESQAPIPEGTGCDAALEDWTRHLAPPKPAAGPSVPRKLPAACEMLLDNN